MSPPNASGSASGSVDSVATRLITLLTGDSSGLRDPSGGDLLFEPSLSLQPLVRAPSPPVEAWAVDGGQCLVADARCLQVYATRASRVCWSGGAAVVEEALPLSTWLLGMGESAVARSRLDAPVADDCFVDVNLLREWGEWAAAEECVSSASAGALVLVDGDLAPDWRISPDWLPGVFDLADDRGVTLAGVTKHTSLSWGGAPLLGVLEGMASSQFGPRAMWWAPVARTSPSAGPGVQVVVARLDPDARFAFRVDLPGYVDPVVALSSLSALCDDAAFPGYPYPLSSADRLAACPSWVRDEVWSRIDEEFDRAGVPIEVRERAFTDRHRLMERY
ncbi:MAG TPA: DNA double-strand break repair nuclease NurA [Acidimicrobiales bacterium]|nr:DNA double-strand break repair nuclease NurA [Acidimicrobiales bacterium]